MIQTVNGKYANPKSSGESTVNPLLVSIGYFSIKLVALAEQNATINKIAKMMMKNGSLDLIN